MSGKVCPVWIGYFLSSPMRKLFQNPYTILGPYVRNGIKVLDIGCAMGFFSLPLARMVGMDGQVICVDVQERMIQSLEKRARKAGLTHRIQTRTCPNTSLGLHDLAGEIDFALAFAMAHEAPDISSLFSEMHEALREKGRALIAEPKGHVTEKDFETTVSIAEQCGFIGVKRPDITRSRAILLEKPRPQHT
ncbi:MAG: class I SAM-dependent methyltransferase [Desulfatiglans sp.]|nr:class I SAM-dependent methyltransferase [Thermodesulfobacteriota bacterium]MEE4354019.1 class I SAM-dependent methyltransferase [Desulfatiglans sp.]